MAAPGRHEVVDLALQHSQLRAGPGRLDKMPSVEDKEVALAYPELS